MRIQGVKVRMDADSCASENIMDYNQYMTIAKKSLKPLMLEKAENILHAYGQDKLLKLAGKFTAEIQCRHRNNIKS